MQTIKTSPSRLWVSGKMNSTPDGDLGPEQLLHYGVERAVSKLKPLLRLIMLSNIMNVANNGLKGNA